MTAKSKPIYDTHAEQVAAFFLDGIENGTSAWFKPWKGGEAPDMPYNATTGKAYRGGNVWVLLARQNELIAEGKITNADDCRWMTYKQALSVGAQVRKGEKSTMGITWGTFEKKDENSKPSTTGEAGADSKLRKSAFASPFFVFHASQIDGLPVLEKAPARDLADSVKAGQKIVDDSKAVVILGGDSAYYRPSTDQIRIPHPDQFVDDGHFMATQLHELSHWTGHVSRLNRDFSFDRSGPDYAREELRAEISSYMIGQRLGLPFDPSQHQAYVASWAQRLKDNPKEILGAVRDAETILKHLNVPERTYEILPQIQQTKGMSMLNDPRKIPTEELREQNYQAWVDRYKDAPRMTPETSQDMAGFGFASTQADVNARAHEANNYRQAPDKERMNLLQDAERHNVNRGENSDERFASMEKLMDYDRKHNHPVADPSRDLKADPYTDQERQTWLRRDGREIKGDELRGLDHDPRGANLEPKPLPDDPDWKIQPKLREQIVEAKQQARAELSSLKEMDSAPTVAAKPMSQALETRRQGLSQSL